MNKKDWWEDEEFDLNLTEEVLAASQQLGRKNSEKLVSKCNLKLKSASFSENISSGINVDNDLMQKYYLLQGENKTLTEGLNKLRQEMKNIHLQEKLKHEENKYHLKFIQQKAEQDLEKIKSEMLFKDKEILDLKSFNSPKVTTSQKKSCKANCQDLIKYNTENVAIQTEKFYHKDKNLPKVYKIFYDLYIIWNNLIIKKILTLEDLPHIAVIMVTNLEDITEKKSLETSNLYIVTNFVALTTLLELFLNDYLKVVFAKFQENIQNLNIQNSHLHRRFIIWDLWFKSIIFKYIEVEDSSIKDVQYRDINFLYKEIITTLPNLFDLVIKLTSLSTEMSQYINTILLNYSSIDSCEMDILKCENEDENTKKISEFVENYVNMNKSRQFFKKIIAAITLTSKIPESLLDCKKSMLNQLIDLFIQLSGSKMQKNLSTLPEFEIPTPILKSLLTSITSVERENVFCLVQILDLFIAFMNIGFDFSKSSCKPKKAVISTSKKRDVPQCVIYNVILAVMSAINGAKQSNLLVKVRLILITKMTDLLYVMASEGQLKVILERNSCDCPYKIFEFLTYSLEYLSGIGNLIHNNERLNQNFSPMIKMTVVTAIQILHTLSRGGSNPLQQMYCPFQQSGHLLVLLYDSLSTFFNVKGEDSLYQDMILDLIQPMMSEEEINQLFDDQNMDVRL